MRSLSNCCICNAPIDDYGHNPQPLRKDGWCCAKCDSLKVSPARLVEAGMKPRLAKEVGKTFWKAHQQQQTKQQTKGNK